MVRTFLLSPLYCGILIVSIILSLIIVRKLPISNKAMWIVTPIFTIVMAWIILKLLWLAIIIVVGGVVISIAIHLVH